MEDEVLDIDEEASPMKNMDLLRKSSEEKSPTKRLTGSYGKGNTSPTSPQKKAWDVANDLKK